MKFRKFDHFLRNLDKKGKKRIWKRTVKFLTCVVVFVTTYALILPAITLESKAHCGESEHQHGDECYEIMKTLICKSEETEGHQHDENCSEKVRTLTCTNEDPEHEHSDSCYQEEAKLICSKEEQSAHHHSDECYKEEKKLVCDRKEHEHEELCYSDPEADLETSKDWKKSIEKIELTGNWADDAVKIAQSQIGVKESKDNFEIDEKTDEKKGISRYGQWYGKPYSDWSAFFTASCLYYSEMPDKDFPYIQDSVDKLVKELDKADYQLSNDFSDVQKGDLVFIANENTNKEDTYSHVGLVESVNEKKNELNLILGDWNNKVERKNFSKTDSSLAGTIRLPENPELNTEENDSEEKDESGRSEPSEDPEPEPDEEPEEDSVSETDLNSQTAAPKKAPARANAETETNNRDNSNQITPLEFNDETEKLNKDKHNLSLEYSSGETKYDSETKSISTQLTLNFNIENGTVNEKGEYILDLAEDLIVPGILNETHYFKYGDDNENGGQYTFVKCDDGHYQLRIKIDEKLVETSRKNQTDISGFITFSAKTDVKQNPDTGDVDLKVADDLNIDIPPKDIEMPDGESINYDLKTKKQGSISLQSNELIYKVNIDSINGTPDTIQVSDIMEALDQSGIKLSDLESPVITVVQTTKKCDKSNNWVDDGSLVKGAEVKIDSSFNVQQGKLEFELPKLNSATEDPNDSTKKIVNGYYIEYRFKVKNLKEGSQVHVGNKITASSKDKITGEKVTSTDTDRIDVGKVDHNPDVLKKGSFNSEQEEITWTITINSNHNDAAGFEIRDDMFKEAIKDSLKLQPDNGIKPSIDDSGNPYFVIQPIENGINTHQYIITYKTKAQGSFNKKEVTNIVKVDKGDIHLTGKDTVNLENGWINKNADSHSEKNGIVTTTWTTTIGTDFGIIDNPFVIEDKWSENQWMSKDQVFEWAGKLNFNDQNNKPLPNISPFCPDPNKYTLTLFDKDGKQYDFQSIKENSDEISSDIRFSRFKIELKNLGETGKKTKRIVITYSTSAKPSDDKNLSIKLKNDVNVKDKNGSGEWTYLKNSDEKTGSADRDKIKWKIKSVVQHGQPINKITISDTLPDRLIFESISIKNLADPSYAASWEPSGNIVYSSANNKADYEITYDGNSRRLNLVIKSSGNQPLPEGSTFEIEYITKVDKDKFTPDDKGLYKEVFENQATVKRNDETDVSEIKAKVDWNYKEEINSKDKIDKQGLWNKDEQTIDYTIVINKDKKQISLTGTDGKTEIPAKLTVHDNLYYWQNESGQHVELLSNTVRLYKGDKVIRNANNNITNEPVDRKDWSWKYEATSDGGNRNNYLTAQVPNDGQSYILVYSYRISFDNPKIPGQTLSVKNTASISATGFQDTDDKTQTPWDKSDFSAGIGTGGFSITKIDSENGNEVLEGVEFTLFEYRDGSYFNTDIKFITNEKGRILIPSKPQKLNNTDFELKSNTAYYLMETKPHPGYIEEYNPRKIYFYYSDNQNKENNQIPSDFVGLDLAKGGHSEIISNIKQNTFTINKVDKDAAGNENSLEGAKFRVYQYDEDSKQFIETEKILTSNENGQVDIKWENNDGFSYQFNRQYYIQEITPPNGYRLPKDPEKIYFHFGHPDKISYPLVANIYSNEWKNSKDLSKAVEPVTVKNERFKGLQILKTDDGLGTGVSGVTFQLEVGNEKTDGTIEWQNSNQFTTNSQGIIVIAENDDNGWLYSQLDAKKVYRIRESNPAAGFIYPNESENNYYYFYKTSDAEFESKVKSKFPNAQNIIDSGLDLRIKNKKYHELTIFKTDQDDPSIPLQGSRFSLQVWNSDTFEDVKFNNKSVVYETGSDGKFKLSSQNFVFAQNTAYRLVEIIPPNGHVLDSELKVVNFFYSSDEKNFSNKPIDFVGHNLFESQLDKTIKNESYHDLCILKTDSKSNKPLEGAEFSLQIWDGTAYKYYLDENNKQMIFKSDLNGQIKLSNQSFKFVKGKAYRLIEIKPASGYLMPAEPPFVEFYFGDEDLNFSKPDDFKGIDLAKTGKTEEIKNTPASRKLKIRKVDEENSSVTLSGVEFTLYKFENNQIQEVKDSSGNLIKFVTDSNGELEASEYVAKNNFEFSENVLYSLRETKTNSNYMLPENTDLFFIFGQANESDFELPDGLKWDDVIKVNGTVSETVKNRKSNELTIVKVDGEDETKMLHEAKFTLYEWDQILDKYVETDQIYTAQWPGQFSVRWQSDKNNGFQFKANTAYCLKETKAPDGYSIPVDNVAVEFYFSETGGELIGPEGHDIIDLCQGDFEKKVKNFKKQLLVQKIWIKNGIEEPPKSEDTRIRFKLFKTEGIKLKYDNWSRNDFNRVIPVGSTVTLRVRFTKEGQPPLMNNVSGTLETDAYGNEIATYVFKDCQKDLELRRPDQFSDKYEIFIEKPEINQSAIELDTEYELNSRNNWQIKFTDEVFNSEEENDGKQYCYFVKEISDLATNHYKVSYDGNDGASLTDIQTIRITNTYVDQGVELPETGGIGTIPVHITGIALSSVAAGTIIVKQRKRKRK